MDNTIRFRERDIINNTLTSIMGLDNFEESAQLIFKACKQLTGGTAGYVAMLSEEVFENEVLFLDSGGRECTVDESLPMPIRGLRAEAYKSGRAVYDNDFHHSSWIKFIPPGHMRMDNVMFAPLIIEKKVIGVIGLANKPGGFNDNDKAMAEIMGQFASVSMFKAREREKFLKAEKSLHEKIAKLKADGKTPEEHRIRLLGLKNEFNELLNNKAD